MRILPLLLLLVLSGIGFAAHTANISSTQSGSWIENNTKSTFNFNVTLDTQDAGVNITAINITLPSGFTLAGFGQLSGQTFVCSNASASFLNCSNNTGITAPGLSTIIQVNATPSVNVKTNTFTINTTASDGSVAGAGISVNVITHNATFASAQSGASWENNTPYTINLNYTFVSGNNITTINVTLPSGFTLRAKGLTGGNTNFACTNTSTYVQCINSTNGLVSSAASVMLQLNVTPKTTEATHTFLLNTTDTQGTYRGSGINVDVDVVSPTFNSYANMNVSLSTGNFVINFSVNANSTRGTVYSHNCTILLYNASDNLMDAVAGTMSASNTSTKCNATISGSQIYGNGAFRIGGWVSFNSTENSDADRYTVYIVNQSNFTKVTLKANDWTLLYIDRAITMEGIANMSRNTIAYVAKYSQSGRNFTTYTTGLSTDAGTAIARGEAVYVYANASTTLLRWLDSTPTNASVGYTAGGWNLAGSFNRTGLTLTQILSEGDATTLASGGLFYAANASSFSSPNTTINYVSYLNSTGKYNTFRRGFSIDQSVLVPVGYGYWIYVNNTVNANQTRMIGGGWS